MCVAGRMFQAAEIGCVDVCKRRPGCGALSCAEIALLPGTCDSKFGLPFAMKNRDQVAGTREVEFPHIVEFTPGRYGPIHVGTRRRAAFFNRGQSFRGKHLHLLAAILSVSAEKQRMRS